VFSLWCFCGQNVVSCVVNVVEKLSLFVEVKRGTGFLDLFSRNGMIGWKG
jgi:hypothetical protein